MQDDRRQSIRSSKSKKKKKEKKKHMKATRNSVHETRPQRAVRSVFDEVQDAWARWAWRRLASCLPYARRRPVQTNKTKRNHPVSQCYNANRATQNDDEKEDFAHLSLIPIHLILFLILPLFSQLNALLNSPKQSAFTESHTYPRLQQM